MNIREEARRMKLDAPKLAATTLEERNAALREIAKGLEEKKHEIFAANEEDVREATENGVAPAVIKRLKYTEEKLRDGLAGINQLISLPDPLGKVQMKRELDEGLVLTRISCPIGVIGVIFEARPDALVQISCLCLKSGNCAILKGGKETARTNRMLFRIIRDSAIKAGMPEGCLKQAELHNEIDELLMCDKDVDLLIPRGSNAFVQYIMNHTKIPVMGHADGVCHIYVDKDADFEKAMRILPDAKMQYTAACNSVETVLIDRAVAGEFLPKLADMCQEKGIRLRGTEEAMRLLSQHAQDESVAGQQTAGDTVATAEKRTDGVGTESAAGGAFEVMDLEEFHKEYLDLVMSVRVVDGVVEAVDHINRFGSHHTDSIITENEETAAYFFQMVDSAGVYQNCSTRFADGFRYGFGAEVGISTSKLHARGPVGLEGLVTYKYLLQGHGQIVGDYASGKAQFHFRELC